MCTLLENKGHEAFNDAELFPCTQKLLLELHVDEDEIIPFRQTRNDTATNPDNRHTLYHGYLLTVV